jgi:FHA domain
MSVLCPHCGGGLPPTPIDRCPRCSTPLVSNYPAAGRLEPTRLETVEDVRRLVEQKRSPSKTEAEDSVRPFRPKLRPPLAIVCLVDDGQETGEWFRVRASKVVLGRTDGDIRVPHDDAISSLHAEIGRTFSGGRYRWYVKDLNSTNGTFARVSTGALERSHEFLIGSRRFRFEMPRAAEATSGAETGGTRAWQSVRPEAIAALAPALVEITAEGDGPRTPLTSREQWIGTDPERCAVVVANDPFVSRQHARIYCDGQERWHIDGGKARNGLWLRIREMAIDTSGEFQAGEQRFLVKVLK